MSLYLISYINSYNTKPYIISDDVFLQIGRNFLFICHAFSREAILSHVCRSLTIVSVAAEEHAHTIQS